MGLLMAGRQSTLISTLTNRQSRSQAHFLLRFIRRSIHNPNNQSESPSIWGINAKQYLVNQKREIIL